jgi:hypothetical protein
MLLGTEDGQAAATDFDLLAQVVKHKAVFFRSGWASYDTARPATLRLMPAEARVKDLRADYRDMAPMMFDDKPLPFDKILARIALLPLPHHATLHLSPARGKRRPVLRERLAEFERPPSHGLMADDDARARGRQFLNHAQPEREAEK